MKTNFSVDESVSADIQKDLILDLKRMVRLGKVAERALNQIRDTGSINSTIPVAIKPKRVSYLDRKKIIGYSVITRRLKTIVELKRHDIPTLRDLEPVIKSHQDGRYLSILVKGSMLKEVEHGDYIKLGEFEEAEMKIGRIWTRKSDFSFEAVLNFRYLPRVKLYTKYNTPKSRKTLDLIANALAHSVVRQNYNHLSNTAKVLLKECLIKEGVAESFALSLNDLLKINQVMNS